MNLYKIKDINIFKVLCYFNFMERDQDALVRAVEQGIEKKTGMTIEEIQQSSPGDLRKRFVKDPLPNLDPFNERDARKIIRLYEAHNKTYNESPFNSLSCRSDIIPHKVVEAYMTLILT